MKLSETFNMPEVEHRKGFDELSIKILKKRLNNQIWTQSDGKTITVIAMESSHIYNTINLLKQKKTKNKYNKNVPSYNTRWIELLTKELKCRTDDKSKIYQTKLTFLGNN